jgi:hypothetical protein
MPGVLTGGSGGLTDHLPDVGVQLQDADREKF